MPFARIIYEKADKETKSQLKMTSKAFWDVHAEEKYKKNFSEAQNGYMWQLYCHHPCPRAVDFEVIFIN